MWELLQIQLGHDLTHVPYPPIDAFRCYASSTNIVPTWHTSTAVLAEISADPALSADPHYGAHTLFHPVGYVLRLPPVAAQYVGWMVAVGATRAEAEEAIQRLASMVHYRLQDVPGS